MKNLDRAVFMKSATQSCLMLFKKEDSVILFLDESDNIEMMNILNIDKSWLGIYYLPETKDFITI